MNEAYYNRVMSDKLVDFLNDKKYKWLIQYVRDNSILDFQTGSNEGSAGKVTRSWFSIYRGTGRVLTLECGSGPKAGLKIHAAAKYMDKDKDFYKTETWERTDVEELKQRFDALLNEIEKDKDLYRYYQDDKGNKKEGYYQTLISRRYSLKCESEDDLIIFDKEFVIGYINAKIKEKWNENPKKWANEMIDKIKVELKGKCPEEIKVPGSECDFVGINKRGDLVLLELKRHEDSTKVYLAPLQVGVYGELVTNLLNSYKTDVEKAIFEMLKQKMKLNMLSPKWKTPERLSGNVRLAVVVGGVSSDEVKRRFKVVRDVIHKDVSHYTCDDKEGTLIEVNSFKDREKDKHIKFVTEKDERVFGEVEGNGKFYHRKNCYTTYPFVLKEDCVDENLYEEIRVSAKEYFRDNGIEWWGDAMKTGKDVPGHTLSSQVACLNHLFRIKNDEKAVLAVINGIKDEYDKVLAIPYDDEKDKGYIAFEVVSNNDYLREDPYNKGLTRGSMCTSIDALINAHHKPTDKNHIILIEWKYTETYKDEDKTCNTRMHRYNEKISESKYLEKPKDGKYAGSVYYQEPFYQLMRQTLWAEKMIENSEMERVKADDYLHIHVVPKTNSVLLDRGFPGVGENMEETWRGMLKEDGDKRYILIDSEVLLKPIKKFKEYRDLIEYLKTRYWRKYKKKK